MTRFYHLKKLTLGDDQFEMIDNMYPELNDILKFARHSKRRWSVAIDLMSKIWFSFDMQEYLAHRQKNKDHIHKLISGKKFS